jgi:hybrid cluster-associated redox disulfide protein
LKSQKKLSIILVFIFQNRRIIPMINITKDTIIGDILDVAPQTAPIFLSIGMHCLGCPSSRGETVEEACMVHGIDVDKLLALVNEEANKAQ